MAILVLALMGLALYAALQYSKISWQKKVTQSRKAKPILQPIASRPPDRQTGIIQDPTLLPQTAGRQSTDANSIRSAVFLTEQARERELEGDLGGALAMYRDAVDAWPHLTDAWASLGRIYLQARQFSKARDALTRAVEQEPDHIEYLNDLGVVHLMQNRVDDAFELFQQAITLDTTYDRSYYNLALCYLAWQDHRNAHRQLTRYVELNPDHVDALRQVAFLDAALGDYAASIQRLKKAIELRPDSAVLHLDVAAAEALLGHDEEALQSLRRAEELGTALEVQKQYAQPAFNRLRESAAGSEYGEGLKARAVTQTIPPTAPTANPVDPMPLLSIEDSNG